MMIRWLVVLTALMATPSYAADIRCALLKDGEFVEARLFDKACPEDLPHKGLSWLPAPIAEKPTFDPETQVLEGPVTVIGEDAVTQEYTVRDKTAQELAAETEARKESTLSDIGEIVLRRICDHESRIRVLEGKSAVTWEQCRAAIKDALQ